VMGWVIYSVVRPTFDPGRPGAAVADLLLGVAIGAVLYPLAIAALWRLTGTDDAIEAQIFRRVVAEIRTRWGAAKTAPP
jgi:hypothetical protein